MESEKIFWPLSFSVFSKTWRETMAKTELKSIVLGFLTVREIENSGLRGGYLLTSEYGRPIEFHYTSVLHVSPMQRALYGVGFEPYVFSQVLALPLTERQTMAPQMIVVDRRSILELRRHIPAPVFFLANETGQLIPHEEFVQDTVSMEKLRSLLPVSLNLHEPFERIEQALQELRDHAMSKVA